MVAALAALFAAALIAPWLERRVAERAGTLLAVVPGAVAVWLVLAQPFIAAGGELRWSRPWVPGLGIDLAFRLDGLASLLALLVTGIGALVLVYASAYLRGHPQRGRFLAFLMVFMGGMLGLVLADDLFVLFVFWELTTVSSFLLIGFASERVAARKAALQSLLVTGAGGLALLVGLLLLREATGTSRISEITQLGGTVRSAPAYGAILTLVALGAFTKSAQVPFHFWLPGAMQAPTPVSAYLHSATMVKAGVFLLARFSPALGGSDAWLLLLGGTGTLTMLVGGAMAIGQRDLKRLLAYSTTSVLGLLTLLLGLGTAIAARAFAVTLLAHAFYKATLFLVVGNVDHAAGTRDVERLSGLRKALPFTAAAAAAGAVSMAGAPPLFGFLAKETAYEAALEAPVWAPLFGAATVATGVCLVFAAARVGLEIFRGDPGATPREPREVPRAMWSGPVTLALAGLAAGLLVGPAERALVAPAAAAILQGRAPTGLALWHGFTPILALSALTLLCGAALYRARRRVRALAGRMGTLGRAGPERAYETALSGLLAVAALQTSVLQSGSLRRYLAVTLTAAFAALAIGLAGAPAPQQAGFSGAPAPLDAAAWLLVVVGAVAAGRARAPLTAVACLGAVGLGVSLLFLGYSAPDLALTQLVIEVLTVILFVLVLPRLPRRTLGRGGARPWTLAIAGFGGVAMTLLTLLAAGLRVGAPISGFFAERSLPEAHGRNVVNVILVDFRALDTLGEITVLAVAALGVLALLRSASNRAHADGAGGTP